MQHVCHRLGRTLFGVAAVTVAATSPAAAFAMSTTPLSCSEFTRTYLEGGLPNGSTVDFALDLYALGPPVAARSDVPAMLTLGYPPYPAVAGQLSGASIDSRRILITFDRGQLHFVLTRGAVAIDVLVLGCVGAHHMYGTAGEEMVGLGLGNPRPPNTSDE